MPVFWLDDDADNVDDHDDRISKKFFVLQIRTSVSWGQRFAGHTPPVTTLTAATTAPVRQVTALPTSKTSSSPTTERAAKVSAC